MATEPPGAAQTGWKSNVKAKCTKQKAVTQTLISVNTTASRGTKITWQKKVKE
jgi:hypothetical protein